MQIDAGPLLQDVPDGVRAPFPVLPALSYVYLALLLGIVPTALAGVVFLGAGRSVRGVLASLVVAGLGFVGPLGVLLAFSPFVSGAEALGPALLVMRILAVGLGFLLYRVAKPVVRGHALLDGAELQLLWVIGPAFAVLFLAPAEVVFGLQLPILLLLASVAG